MIVLVTAPLVVEADPEFFPVLRQLDLERLAGWATFLHPGAFRLEKERVGVTGLLRQRQSLTGPPVADAPGSPRDAIGTGDVLSRHVAAAVDAAAGPDAHHVAL